MGPTQELNMVLSDSPNPSPPPPKYSQSPTPTPHPTPVCEPVRSYTKFKDDTRFEADQEVIPIAFNYAHIRS